MKRCLAGGHSLPGWGRAHAPGTARAQPLATSAAAGYRTRRLPMPLEDDLDVLYACPFGEFLDCRKALAQALRKAGRKEDAAKVAGAVKPTPAAWAVNQLARAHAEELAALIEIGDRWRARMLATSRGHADANAMSEARSAQRNLVARLTRIAAQLLEAAGASSSSTTLERVAATLTTISTTGAWGGCPAGQLTRELDPPGFEVLAALVGGTTREAVPVGTPRATGDGPKENVPPEEDAQELQKAQEEDRPSSRSSGPRTDRACRGGLAGGLKKRGAGQGCGRDRESVPRPRHFPARAARDHRAGGPGSCDGTGAGGGGGPSKGGGCGPRCSERRERGRRRGKRGARSESRARRGGKGGRTCSNRVYRSRGSRRS